MILPLQLPLPFFLPLSLSKHPSQVLGGGQPHQAATEAVSLHEHGAAIYHLAVAWIQKYSGDCCINSLMGQNNQEYEQKHKLKI